MSEGFFGVKGKTASCVSRGFSVYNGFGDLCVEVAREDGDDIVDIQIAQEMDVDIARVFARELGKFVGVEEYKVPIVTPLPLDVWIEKHAAGTFTKEGIKFKDDDIPQPETVQVINNPHSLSDEPSKGLSAAQRNFDAGTGRGLK